MKRPILVILVVQFLLGVVYAASTPPFEASDEVWHFPVVRELATTGRLPVQIPGVKTPWAQEGSQPPLYYAVGAALTGWINTSDFDRQAEPNPFAKLGVPGTADNINLVRHHPDQRPWQGGALSAVYLIRLLSILMATGTVYATYRLAGTAFPRRPRLALLAAALAAFNPMYLFISASVNNDNLAILMTSVALWLLIADLMSATPSPRWRSTILLGIVMSMAALSKLSGAVLLPVSALVVTISAWRQRSWRAWLLRGATLVAIVLTLTGWWFARNLNLYGELFGINRMSIIAGPRPAGFHLANLWSERLGFWYSYWGVFGGFNILAPHWYLVLVSVLAGLAVVGLALLLGRGLTGRRRLDWSVHATLLLFLVLSLAGVVNWTLKTMASQGRLMFGGIAPISLYLALGLLAWVPVRWRRAAVAATAVFLAAAAAFIAFTAITPSYRPPRPIAALPAGVRPLDIWFGDSIHLVGYSAGNAAVTAGQPIDVTLYWTSPQPPAEDANLALNGYGYQGENVAKIDTWPGGGLLPTSQWAAGALYPDSYRLVTLPNANAPTTVGLNVGFWQGSLDHWLPIRQDGKDTTFVILPVSDLVAPAGAAKSPETAPLATFDKGIRLRSYEARQEGGTLHLRLNWDTTAPVGTDYTVFVHLDDSGGNVVAQADSPPRGGSWPTSRWRQGEAVPSDTDIALPAGLPAGEYKLRVGLYTPADGARLPANDPNGQPWQDYAVVLGPLTLAAP